MLQTIKAQKLSFSKIYTNTIQNCFKKKANQFLNQNLNFSTKINEIKKEAKETTKETTKDKTKEKKRDSKSTAFDNGRPLYFDFQATTPVDPRVLDRMLPLFTEKYGNPHSRTHAFGWEAEDLVEEARKHIADLISATPNEVIFTSGATESNNIAVKGVSRFLKPSGKTHVITSQIEHKCVLDSCRALENEGFNVTYLPVNKFGLVSLDDLKKAITKKTALVSIMTVNNEIGVIQPIGDIGQICKQEKVWFHTDGAQAIGKIPIDVNKMNIDLLSMSGHKIYGPKGIGGLYVRRRPRVRLEPIQSGGGQERGIRSGTLPAPLAIGFGEAARIAKMEMKRDHEHITKLSKRLWEGVQKKVPKIILNGHPEKRYPGCINISFSYIEGESLLMALKDIALSSGSACTSASLEPSYVLRALGVEEEMAHTSIRFGIGRFTTEKEIDYVVDSIQKQAERLRKLSILWEMAEEGIDLKTIKWNTD
ncbi:cysteine desulfurase [Anaeramoeba ignava]|uniref:cysteine desulfurase n=1 Tax=Anaeramoeba ignava TaxID=1746090 RepID=A0A9Q0LDT6_ANAIG|nr:cysteine desulfurase [Anaeramoeba ignava]|eukprot:Anaeramoba_ignava/a607953_63.p1 GENE.a607953_63~~a607953_63.p1  ORF type:complete len:479 (-),score=154.12 a607953_63:81-1517(-)